MLKNKICFFPLILAIFFLQGLAFSSQKEETKEESIFKEITDGISDEDLDLIVRKRECPTTYDQYFHFLGSNLEAAFSFPQQIDHEQRQAKKLRKEIDCPPPQDTTNYYLSPKNSQTESHLLNFCISPKHLGKSNCEQSTTCDTQDYEWLNHPSLEFTRLKPLSKPLGKYSSYYHTKPTYSKFTLNNSKINAVHAFRKPPVSNERITFVIAGAKDKSDTFIPEEIVGGRVIIVMPYTEEENLQKYINSYTDVLLVYGLNTSSSDRSSINLPSTLRLAALYYAETKGLDDFIMLDDNISAVYLTPHVESSWASVYRYLKTISSENGLSCLSASKELSPPTESRQVFIHKRYGNSLFYINFKKIMEILNFVEYQNLNISNLLPAQNDLWGEDLWMQILLKQLQLNVATLDSSHLSIAKSDRSHPESYSLPLASASTWESKEVASSFRSLPSSSISKKTFFEIISIIKWNFNNSTSA